MKSTASIHTHPIHPMLIPFPFAFLTGAWGFRVAAAFSENDDLKTVSRYLVPAGLIANAGAHYRLRAKRLEPRRSASAAGWEALWPTGTR